MKDKILTPSGIISFDDIVEMVKDKKCVLLLGPKLYSSKEGITIEERIQEALLKNKWFKSYYEEDGFFLFQDNIQRGRALSQIRKTYQQTLAETKSLIENIVQIPFEIIVSLMPDKTIYHLSREMGLPYQFSYYHKGEAAKALEYKLEDIPLIYNLLGSLEADESLVLTYDDFYNFLDSLFKEKSMNIELKHELLKAESYIFLGFPFEKWYMRVLLRILSLHVDSSSFIRIATSKQLALPVQTMYKEELKIAFVPDNIEAFVEKLFTECQSAGILRKVEDLKGVEKHGTPLQLEDVKKSIADSEYELALKSFKKILDKLDHEDEKIIEFDNRLVKESGQFHQLQRDKMNGVISDEISTLKINRIIQNLLFLLIDLNKWQKGGKDN